MTLNKLKEADWFRSVGVQDSTDAVIILGSWKEAVKHCSSTAWQNLCLEAANQYRERLVEKSMERFRDWNKIVREIKPSTQALVQEKTKKVIEENSLGEAFKSAVNWDILHLCMESEYADVYPPGFYAGQAYWYMNGHFPCGWRGKFPEGKLLIY